MFWELLKALFLGIVEGVTEWLPISSTGHLILVDAFLKLDASDAFKEMFDVVIQLGAILAVVVIYWKNLWPFHKKETNPNPLTKTGFGACVQKNILQMWCKVLVACVPAAVVGLLFDDVFHALFYNPITVAIMLILFGVAFIVIERWQKTKQPRIHYWRTGLQNRVADWCISADCSRISRDFPFWCNHCRSVAAGRFPYRCGRIYVLLSRSGHGWCKPVKAGQVWLPLHRHGICRSAGRHG